MTYEFAGSYPEQRVRLTFGREAFLDPGYVLVFAFYEGQLLLTRHRTRGWEIPGGTREAGEFPIQTAIREVYEETGAVVEALEPIGQYVIDVPNAPQTKPMIKTIYVAKIAELLPLPQGFETEERRLFDVPPEPDWVKTQADYSPVLKDEVYPLALQRVCGHRFAGRTDR